MNYPIPVNPQEIARSQEQFVSPELIASAIAGTIAIARTQGRSLQDLMQEVLADDALLDLEQRQRLSEIVALAWNSLP